MDGEWKFYYEEGTVEWIGQWIEGEKHGVWEKYEKNGKLKYKEEYTGKGEDGRD